MMEKLRNKKKKGFTLIELIVVIAILGILAAIAVPRLLGFQDRAKATADQQVAAQVKSAVGLAFANGEVKFSGTGEAVFNVKDAKPADPDDAPDVEIITASTMTTTDTQLEAILDDLISDFNLVSGRTIRVTVDDGGSVKAELQ